MEGICHMNQVVRICYWETEENTVSIQLSGNKNELESIKLEFNQMQIIATGKDFLQDEDIVIYKKSFNDKQQLVNFLLSLKKYNIELKEVK